MGITRKITLKSLIHAPKRGANKLLFENSCGPQWRTQELGGGGGQVFKGDFCRNVLKLRTSV